MHRDWRGARTASYAERGTHHGTQEEHQEFGCDRKDRDRREFGCGRKGTTGEQPKPAATPKKVADLSVGEIVLIPGFDGPRTIRGAAKVTDGADAGKLDVALRDEAGDVEHARFGPDEEVQVVGKAPKGAKHGAVPAESAARKTASKGKGGKARASKPEGAKKTKKDKAPKSPKEKKTSALDAAAKVLGEKGEPMNCQELIRRWRTRATGSPRAG